MTGATYDPQGPTPIRVGLRETTLGMLPYWHGTYTVLEAGSVLTLDGSWVDLPLGSIVHRETERDNGDVTLVYWIQIDADDGRLGRGLSHFPMYRS